MVTMEEAGGIKAMEGPEKQLRVLMAVYAFIYLAFGLVLLVYPQGIMRLINWVTDSVGLHPPVEIPRQPFWSMVCVSLLLTLALICYLAYRDISNRQLVWIMIFAKYVSSLSLTGYMVLSREHPPGFGVGAVVDAFLGTLALVFVLRAQGRGDAPGTCPPGEPD